MINKDTLDILNNLGFGADIDSFENYIEQLMDANANGNPLVTDAQYDVLRRILVEIKPESKLLTRNWENEELPLDKYDKVLEKYGMCSIHTIDGINISSMSDFCKVIDKAGGKVDIFASMKQNGHATRAVYVYGKLHGGTTRGRYKKGRDISRHLRAVLPAEIEGFKSMPIVEVRGEMVVSKSTFNNYLKATGLKTPLSSVTSLIRDSVTDEELKYLSFVGYKVIPSVEEYRPKTLSQEYSILEKCGIQVPKHVSVKGVTKANLVEAVEAIIAFFEEMMDTEGMEYDCDGVVVGVDDNELFYASGKNGNAWIGNFAVKEGKYWQSNIYESTILEVRFNSGKKYLTPYAIVEPVICKNGATVENVPLYNIGVMERYQLYSGQQIYFRFGGEQGVTLCDEYGESVRAESLY